MLIFVATIVMCYYISHINTLHQNTVIFSHFLTRSIFQAVISIAGMAVIWESKQQTRTFFGRKQAEEASGEEVERLVFAQKNHRSTS